MRIPDLVKRLDEALKQGCRFISFMYYSKGTGETSIYVIAINIDIANAYRRDLVMIPMFSATTRAQKLAKAELIDSLNDSLTNGIGKNRRYTQRGNYIHVARGVRINRTSGELDLFGFVVSKEQIKRGEEIERNSSEKTIAKKRYRARMKSGKFRNFLLNPEHIAGIKINGEILEIQNK